MGTTTAGMPFLVRAWASPRKSRSPVKKPGTITAALIRFSVFGDGDVLEEKL
jgi:hypothetical protein